jgi:hypothetical protein
LLELDAGGDAPAGLGDRVLTGLAAARREEEQQQRLERLLDMLPDPTVPPQLGARVLRALEEARRPAPRVRWISGGAARLAAAAAVLVFIGLALLWTFGDRLRGGSGQGVSVADGGDEVEEDLLASLDVLENWELLTSTEIDDLLAHFDSLDEELLELEEEG